MLQNLLHSNKWPESEPTWFLSNTLTHFGFVYFAFFVVRRVLYVDFLFIIILLSSVISLRQYHVVWPIMLQLTLSLVETVVCVCCAWLWCTCSHWWLFKIQKQFFGIWSTCIRFTSIFESKFQIYWLRYFCYLSNLEQLFRCFSNCCCLEN